MLKIFGSKGDKKEPSLPLHAAAKSGDMKALTEALKSAECHIDALDGDGQTALSIAIAKGNEKVVAQLLEHNASVAVRHRHTSGEQTPRELAVEKGRKHMIELLDVAEARAMK